MSTLLVADVLLILILFMNHYLQNGQFQLSFEPVKYEYNDQGKKDQITRGSHDTKVEEAEWI